MRTNPLAVLAAAAIALFVDTDASAASVYRCVSGTHVEYRDQPCANEAHAAVVPVAPAGGGLVLTQATGDGSGPADSAAPVAPGMSPRAVYQAMGRPVDMNVRIEGIMPIERWWYRTSEGTLTVTFRHGRVASAVTR